MIVQAMALSGRNALPNSHRPVGVPEGVAGSIVAGMYLVVARNVSGLYVVETTHDFEVLCQALRRLRSESGKQYGMMIAMEAPK